jgi:hypothetical protein
MINPIKKYLDNREFIVDIVAPCLLSIKPNPKKGAEMILVRDIFQVKFGKAQDAIASWKEGYSLIKKAGGNNRDFRLLTDMAGGNYYTLVLESEYKSLAEFEEAMLKTMSDKDWKNWYQKFLPLAESGRREILNVVQ